MNTTTKTAAVFCLDAGKPNWPAQVLLCRKLGIAVSEAEEGGRAFSLPGVLLRFMTGRPWQIYRIWGAIILYWDCLSHLRYLQRAAARLRTEQNRALADHILRQAGANLLRETEDCWPELTGLAMQKLLHLEYYAELMTERHSLDREPAEI